MSPATSEPRFSQFVEFTVQPLQAAALAEALLIRARHSTCRCSGFINCAIHMNEQDNRVFMHLLWESQTQAESAIGQMQSVKPDLFQLALQHNATALSFSAYDAVGEVCAGRPALDQALSGGQ